jgi:arabinogalactan endo-1,4-beta-galactosidase
MHLKGERATPRRAKGERARVVRLGAVWRPAVIGLVRNGILWPVGQVDPAAGTGFDDLATLLKAGVDGARQANPRGHALRLMLHYDEGGDTAASTALFRRPADRGVPFDVIGPAAVCARYDTYAAPCRIPS